MTSISKSQLVESKPFGQLSSSEKQVALAVYRAANELNLDHDPRRVSRAELDAFVIQHPTIGGDTKGESVLGRIIALGKEAHANSSHPENLDILLQLPPELVAKRFSQKRFQTGLSAMTSDQHVQIAEHILKAPTQAVRDFATSLEYTRLSTFSAEASKTLLMGMIDAPENIKGDEGLLQVLRLGPFPYSNADWPESQRALAILSTMTADEIGSFRDELVDWCHPVPETELLLWATAIIEVAQTESSLLEPEFEKRLRTGLFGSATTNPRLAVYDRLVKGITDRGDERGMLVILHVGDPEAAPKGGALPYNPEEAQKAASMLAEMSPGQIRALETDIHGRHYRAVLGQWLDSLLRDPEITLDETRRSLLSRIGKELG